MNVVCIFFGMLLISFASAGTPYVVFEENGKSGVRTSEGKVVIPAKYDAIGWSNGKFSIVENVTGFRVGHTWGLINLSNQKVTRNDFTDLYPAEGSLFIAGKKTGNSSRSALGCINTAGKNIIPFLYDGISIASFRAIVYTHIGNQLRYGLIDLQNKTIIPQHYQEVRPIGTLRYAVRNFDGKIALFAENGQQITGFDIDSLSAFQNNLARIFQGKNVGIIDRDGRIQIQPIYREIEPGAGREARVRQADEWIFLSAQNKSVRTVQADSITNIGSHLYKISTGRQAQIVDRDFRQVGESVLTDVKAFRDGRAIYQLGSLFGVIMDNGKLLVPALYTNVLVGTDYIIAAQRSGNTKTFILFDSLGNRRVSRAYESISPLGPGLFAARHRGFFGVLNGEGKEVVACAYDSILDHKDAHLLVKFKGLYGIINTSEKWVVSPRPNKLSIINENRFLEYGSSSTFVKERNGNVIYFTSNRIEVSGDHFLEYLPSGTIWSIDMNGVIINRQVMPAEVTEAVYEESEGYRAIKRNGRFGFIDDRGRLRIANRYEAVQPFREGHAAVKILGKWGFINLQDNIAVQPVYEQVLPFNNGVAKVKQKGLFGMIDTKGKLVLPVRYAEIEVLPSGNYLISTNGLKGLADKNGTVIIQPRFDTLVDSGNGHAVAGKSGAYGVVAYNGVTIIPMMYQGMRYDREADLFIALKKASWQTVRF